MEEERRSVYTIVAIVAVVSILLSCIAGALAGGLAGLVAGRRQGEAAAERVAERLQGDLGPLPGLPIPLPGPGLEGRIPVPEDLPTGTEGALILEVIADTPAEEAGLEVGDLITGIDRTPIDANHPLPEVIAQYAPGDRITIRFWRAGDEDSVLVDLARHPEDTGRPYLGVYFEMISWPRFRTPSD